MPESYSKLVRNLGTAGIQVFVHRASFDDIGRDDDKTRRENSISKLKKYAAVEKSDRDLVKLTAEFGQINSPNDETDCQILSAIADGAADVLVTEDTELHRRAARFKLQDKVFRVRQLADYLSALNSVPETTVKFIVKKTCYQLDKNDPIFNSLRSDYQGFDNWWVKSCSLHRQCWIVRDENDNIAGLVVFNDESETSGDGLFPSSRVLKLCTFKVSEPHRGGRLGEQLLKQSIWHAVSAKYDVAYLTVFEKQTSLIDLLKLYGFVEHSNKNGELVFAKMLNATVENEDQYAWHLMNYPKLHNSPIASAIIPIKPEFHKRLLPEASPFKAGTTLDMFEGTWSSKNMDDHIPATAIRKVYVCKSQTKNMERGTRLYFYVTKNSELEASQSLSAIGILEDYKIAGSLEELIRSTAKRSVYRIDELEKIYRADGPTKILNFIIVGTCSPSLKLIELGALGILKGAPQSIVTISNVEATILRSTVKPNYLS